MDRTDPLTDSEPKGNNSLFQGKMTQSGKNKSFALTIQQKAKSLPLKNEVESKNVNNLYGNSLYLLKTDNMLRILISRLINSR